MLLLAASTAACGPLPRPFAHEKVNALVSDQRALAPLAVRRIDGAPGLAEALIQTLNQEDIAASPESAGDGFLSLSGKIRSENGTVQLIWQIIDGDGRMIGEFRQPLPPGSIDPARNPQFVQSATRAVIHALRGDDSGTRDLEAAPKVAVWTVKAPADFDGDALSRAMARALGLKGLAVVSGQAAFVVTGLLRIGPTTGGQAMVSIDWTVRDAKGHDLGTVSQSSPVAQERLLGPLAALLRDIAEAGADGIAEVIRSQRPQTPPEP
ncbi:hypothetical protein CWS72_13740 [Telmatospirillum siberiense]|uniref:ABC-type transport auxiliary lipoprotein component domain-containing protein n=2 Tax=Telmatospirillum siberiense TaxID=382514 RepID=A0A2N3PU53_9PROT|nr:hypothetical protein CWS72_13740 [Telmatospirillum siberiense]